MANKKPVASVNTREYDILIQLLKETRTAKRVSQRKLSDQLGRSNAYVQKIEDRDRRVDVCEFYNFAKALDVDPVELFKTFASRVAS